MNLRMGLVGAGIMGRNHARVLEGLGRNLAGVADVDETAAAQLAKRCGSTAYSGPTQLLNDPEIDAVVIATPTATHFELARLALNSGKHVLVEKPIAYTSREARELIRIADRAGRVLAVGHVERHNPVVRWVADHLREKSFGEPIALRTHRLSPFPDRIRDVGVVMDIAIHDLDVISYLCGMRPVGVYAVAGTHRPGIGVEDHASILTDFSSELSSFTEVSWLTPTKVRTLTVTCEEAVIEANYMAQEVTVSKGQIKEIDADNMFDVPVDFTVQRVSLRKEEPLRNEHIDFARAILDGSRPLANGQDGLDALVLCEKALQSANSRTRVLIGDKEL